MFDPIPGREPEPKNHNGQQRRRRIEFLLRVLKRPSGIGLSTKVKDELQDLLNLEFAEVPERPKVPRSNSNKED